MSILIEKLRALDDVTLRKIAGPVIVSAVESATATDTEERLAEILLLKYDRKILDEKEIRLAIIDGLSPQDAKDFCRDLSFLEGNPFVQLHEYFSSYSASKSEQLVGFLGLDFRFVKEERRDDREAEMKISIELGEKIALKPYLHPFQKRLKDETMNRLERGESHLLLQMPTGAGKTYTALEAVVDHLRKPRMDQFVVWLVDTNELAEQALASFLPLWKQKGDKEITLFRLFKNFSSRYELVSGGVVFASFQKLHSVINNPNHDAYQSVLHLIRCCELLIVDEAHTSVADTYEHCIQQFVRNEHTRIVGLTATPGRSDLESTEELVAMYHANLITMKDSSKNSIDDPIRYLQDKGYLARLKTQILETDIEVDSHDEDEVLKKLASDADRNDQIMSQIVLADEANESTLVFACTLDHVFALTILCRLANIKSEFIVGNVEQERRLDILEGFRKGEFSILINLDILSAGVDLPNVDKIVITRPIGSPVLYSQIIGRALRGPRNGGNEENTIVNIRDNLLHYPSANMLYTRFNQDWDTEILRR